MKHIQLWSLFLLLLFTSYSSIAAKHYTYLYSNLLSSNSLSIDECVFADTCTIITMTFASRSGTWFKLSRTLYACDEQGDRHQIIRAEDLTLDKSIWLDEGRAVTFKLFFHPLPRRTRIFDIIQGQKVDVLHIYGIHDAHRQLKIPVAKEEIKDEEVEQKWFKTDTTIIRGRISNYNRSMPHLAEVLYKSPNVLGRGRDNGLNYAKIEADGTFRVAALLDNPKWTEVTLGYQRFIPFYARPGDTIDFRIDNYGEWNERYSYSNAAGHPTYERLMQCFRFLSKRLFGELWKIEDIGEFNRRFSETKKVGARLIDYWAWKYQLSPWESHLLKNNWRMQCLPVCCSAF